VLLTGTEDCGGAVHLHPSVTQRHDACPACLTAVARLAAPWRTPDLTLPSAAAPRPRPGAAATTSRGILRSNAGRAPPAA
jgi:hypothetical protein